MSFAGRKKQGRPRRAGIRKKILMLVWACVVPMAAVAIYAIIAINSFYRQYDNSVQNITRINEFNMTFEQEMYRSMYYIIVEAYDWNKLKGTDDSQNPYVQIETFQERLPALRAGTKDFKSLNDIDAIERMLQSLKSRVDDIIVNVEDGGHYDENMDMLSDNINVLTSLIQKDINDYISLEAANMESVRQDISVQVRVSMLALVVIVCILLVLTLLLSSRISNTLTEPIRTMCHKTELFAGGDFSVRYDPKSGDELETLAESFNSMVQEISNLVEDIKTEQKNAKDAELRLLQAQINPHFLYNTLDAIMWLVESGQNEQAVSMVASLSSFFRTTLSKGRDWITVREEESHIRSYLEIQKFRYADILDYEIEIPKEMGSYYLMKLMLQPIVENALYHGIKNKRGKGLIRVSGREDGDDLLFIVEDNGIGMMPAELARMRGLISGEISGEHDQHGYGIANIAQRIHLNYGSEY
ncbi:MAG: sensor histidine kinase, partial [Lachnospiraceae bacterium]|nr:sensor histidine kinase [Lachnospiraceae bacterium]